MNTHPNILDVHNSALLVIDVQQKLTAAMPETEAATMVKQIANLMVAARILDVPVFITEQYPQGLGHTVEKLQDKCPKSALQFEKTGFSCTSSLGFNQALAKSLRRQVILTGIETHVCVLQTALALLHDDYHVYVVEDAVCSRKPNHKHGALQRMQQQGVTLTNPESVMFEWLKGSHHPDFKTIAALIR